MKYKYTLKQNVLFFFSPILNLIRIFYRTSNRPIGISMLLRIKNEADWIQASLLSLQGFADEAIIIDNGSTDGTYEKIKDIVPKLEYKVILKRDDSSDYVYLNNLTLSLSKYKWLFRWDGDFIAYTSGQRDIKRFRQYLLNLPINNYYRIFPLLISLSGDFYHVLKGRELHSEAYVFCYHPNLKYVQSKKYEVLKFPLFYKILRFKNILFYHIGTAKSLTRMLYRSLWWEWLRSQKYGEKISFSEYLKSSFTDEKLAEKYIIEEMKEKIGNSERLSVEKYGNYPVLMKPLLENPPYRIIYKDGKPFTRNDFPE